MSISSLERTKVGNFMVTPGLFASSFWIWIHYFIFIFIFIGEIFLNYL